MTIVIGRKRGRTGKAGTGGKKPEPVEQDRKADEDGTGDARRRDDGRRRFISGAGGSGKDRRSYKDFLQRFSVLREEIGVDPESLT